VPPPRAPASVVPRPPATGWSAGSPSTAAAPRRARADDDGAQAGRPGYLILDVCGAFVRDLGGWFPVAKLVVLMGELQVDEQATRSAVSRITKRGLLVPEHRDGQRGYVLSPAARETLDEADRHIFGRSARAALADGWVIATFSVPEDERDKRHVLRSRLAWLGFGLLANGVWIAPARLLPELQDSMARLGLSSYLTVFVGQHRGEDPRELVERCWDLDGLRELYVEFLDHCGPLRRRWARREPVGVEAFVDYTLLLNQWRTFPYLDPGLPAELLPRGWEGQRAADAFFALRDRLSGPALAHVAEVMGLPAGTTRPAAAPRSA
jgi:phenylacetic acid degradation operon negative regulatory protein